MRLLIDSLRYWVEEMHVDGFRFDLAPALPRDENGFTARSGFFAAIHQDPVLSRVKLIAEPWDLGPGGDQVGGFPRGWAEWNGRYRDTLRTFWRGERAQIGALASRLAGSSDIYQASGRGPHASITYVTSHDGFTLRDLMSFERKHNEANGENNRDGWDNNLGRNWGTEGPALKQSIVRIRDRMARNFLAALAFSAGTPMIAQGDEIGHTQGGNNNAYCQDNETSWVDWKLGAREKDLLSFARHVFAVRRDNPTLTRQGFFSGEPPSAGLAKDLTWVRPDGGEMTESDWLDPRAHVLGMLVHRNAANEAEASVRRARGQTTLLLLNGGWRSCHWTLPSLPEKGVWQELVNAARPVRRRLLLDGVHLTAHSLILLRYNEEQ